MDFLKIWLIVSVIVLALYTVLLSKFTAFFTALKTEKYSSIRKNIVYKEGSDNPKHRLDVYIPKNRSASYPFVMFLHGGYWVAGDKNYHQLVTGLYATIGYVLNKAGIGVAVSNYRLSPETTIEGQLDDVSSAKEFIYDHMLTWGGNGKLIVMGHSAGAHLATLLITSDTKKQLSGCIALSPVVNIKDMVATQAARFNEKISYPVFGRDDSLWDNYSPAVVYKKHADALTLTRIYIAEHDFAYLKQQNVTMQHELEGKKHTVTLEVIPGLNHAGMVAHFGKPSNVLSSKVIQAITELT